MTPDSRKRVFVVVLDGNLTDNAATNVRNGIRMYRSVQRVVPVDVETHNGHELIDAIKQDVMGEAFDELRRVTQQRDELAGRIARIQAEVTGGIPAQSHERDDPLRDVPLWTRKGGDTRELDMRNNHEETG